MKIINLLIPNPKAIGRVVFLLTFPGLLLFNNFIVGENIVSEHFENFPISIYSPDSIYEDSIIYQEGDTVEVYITGWDSVYILYEDTTNDSISPFAWDIPFETEHMLIELTEYHHEIEQGLFGVNVTDLFETRHANEFELADYATGESPWDYLVALKPKVLRFPSGAGGKFMQPLGSMRTADYDPEPAGSMNGGYGFNIEEIIAFYDATLPGIAPPLYDIDPGSTSISEDMADNNNCDNCGTWMNDGDFEDDFEGFYRKWFDQPVFDPTGLTTEEMDNLYINSFIRLVDRIEDENDYEVDVIVCLNILNQTATECVDLIDYLLNNTISRVHVVGVELGNEVYFKFGADAMGFKEVDDVSAFEHYWDYINGFDYTEYSDGADDDDGEYSEDDFDLTTVLPTDVQADHNYIREIREYGDHTIKIGLPAMNFNQCDEWDTPFIIDDPDDDEIGADPLEEDCDCEDYPIWNDDMATKFTKTLSIGSTPYIKFDAVILHNYLVAGNAHAGCPDNTNWQRIAANAAFTDDAPYDDAWTYSPSPDIYLSPIYEGLAGIPVELEGDDDPVIQDGNFKDFAKTDLKTAYDIHGIHLFYTDEYESSDSKEIWFTELNLLNKAKGGTAGFDQDFVNMVPNSFVHAVVLENWLLWYVKEYFDTDYNPGVFKYATFQSFLGGNAIDYMSPSSKNDQIKLNIPDPDLVCSDEEWDNDFYVRRATYYLMQLMNEIPFHNLEYARSSIGLYTNNYNLPPSTFTELDEEGDVINIYVFYTNIKSTTQKYVFDPGDLHEAIFEATSVSLGVATIHALDPTDLFSTAGRSGVYGNAEPDPADDPINIYYNCDEGYGSNKYPFEIVGISTSTSSTSCPGGFTPPTGGICVTVPATSAGYFVIPVSAYRLGEVKDVYAIYPNPASTNFVIHQIDPHHSIIKNMSVEIYNMYGGLIQTTTVDEGQAINISQLPVGIYTVIIKTEGLKTESESLIKMK